MIMILPSQFGWSQRCRVVTILACILVLSEWYSSPHQSPFVSAVGCLIPLTYECSSSNENKTKNAPVVVQVVLYSCAYGTGVIDPGGASLSVDWGEDPTMFEYDTVIVDYETGQAFTDLPLWNYESNGTMMTTTTTSTTTSYNWRWNESVVAEPQEASDQPWTISIRHAYTQPGRYWPIFRSIGLNSNLSEGEIMETTCQYQDATINSGHRNESICLREKDFTRPRIDIGTDGSCSIVEVSSSSSLFSGAAFCARIAIGVVGLVVAWGF